LKFLLYSYKYDWRVGGIVVLNKLADVLADIGFETYIIGEDNEINGKAVRVSKVQAIEIVKDESVIVIYPEVIRGNPLNAAKVARWILYFPGIHGGDETYDTSEFIFSYNSKFVSGTQYEKVPVVRIIETMVDHFNDLGMSRSKDAILIKKGAHEIGQRMSLYLQPVMPSLKNIMNADSLIENTDNVSDFNKRLNEFRYFISYDNYSYHSVLAALAGCISVVIPQIGKSKEDFFSEYSERRFGISYGFENAKVDPSEIEMLRDELLRVESNNVISANDLVNSLRSHFKL